MEIYKEYLSYNKDSGVFTWVKSAPPRGRVGHIAGCINKNGYVCISLKGKQVYAHRLAWYFCKGSFPETDVDHINGDPLDNRIENLRCVTHRENVINKKQLPKGVRKRNSGRWEARLGNKSLGTYESETEATKAYIKECKMNGYVLEKRFKKYEKPKKKFFDNRPSFNLSQISREKGIPQPTLHYRVFKLGMTIDEAINFNS